MPLKDHTHLLYSPVVALCIPCARLSHPMRHDSCLRKTTRICYTALCMPCARLSHPMRHDSCVQPIADRVALSLEIILKTKSTNQNSAHGIYEEYQVINHQSHENPGAPGTKLKVFRNNVKMLCHPICNWLYIRMYHRLFCRILSLV